VEPARGILIDRPNESVLQPVLVLEKLNRSSTRGSGLFAIQSILEESGLHGRDGHATKRQPAIAA
jgi:hypothetical protein